MADLRAPRRAVRAGAPSMADATQDDDPRRPGIARAAYVGLRADGISAVSMAVVTLVVSRGLGPSDRGVFFLAYAAALVIVLLSDVGMSAASITFSANRRVPLPELHGMAVVASLGAATVGAAVLLPLHEFWTASVLKGLDLGMLGLLSAGIAPMLYGQIALALLTGLGLIPATAALRISQAMVLPLLIVPATIATGDPKWTLAAWLVATLAFAGACAVYTLTRVTSPRLPSPSTVRAVVSFGLRGWVGTVAHHGFLRVDVFFLSARFGPRPVGIYSLASTVAERISLLGQALYGASAARLGGDERNDAARLVAAGIRMLLLLLLPVSGLLALLGWAGFGPVFGEGFDAAALPFAILLPGTIALTLWSLVSLYIVSTLRRPGTTTLIQGSALLASLPLYFFAVKSWQMTGAAVVSSVVYTAVFAMGTAVLIRTSDVQLRDLLPRRSDGHRLTAFARSIPRRRSRA